jgi:outer membrane protein assembly factor BamE (lipoprotein component of BamABCDE complex)
MVFCLTALLSCIQRNKGFYFRDINMARNFDVYNFTKDDLIGNIGQPSLKLDDGVWLYYSYTYKNPLFRKNKIYSEKILLVYFDDNDKIINHSFNEREFVGNITDIERERKKMEGNILREFFKGLIFTPINNT